MNPLDLFSTPVCLRLALALLHFLWQGVGIALAAVALASVTGRKSSRTRYGIYMGSLLLMALSVMGTYCLVTPSLLRTPQPLAAQDAPLGALDTSATSPSRPAEAPQPLQVASPQPLLASWQATEFPVGFHIDWQRWAPGGVALYLLGVVLMTLRLLLGLRGGQRLRSQSTSVDDVTLLTALQRQAQTLGLKIQPALLHCAKVTVPTVVGVIRPVILLPLSFASGLTVEQVEMLLCHELAHIRRWDPFWNVVQRTIEALLFFHPAVWFISRRVRLERENCCDDLVLQSGGSALSYAASLLDASQRSLAPSTVASLASVGLEATGRTSQIRSRVLRLVGEKEEVRLRRPMLILIPLVLVALLVVMPFLGRADDANQDETTISTEATPRSSIEMEKVRARVGALMSTPIEYSRDTVLWNLYILRHFTLAEMTETWCGAIRELVHMGKQAVPDVVAELVKTRKSKTQSALAIALRAIGDPRAVPALISALGNCQVVSSDYAMVVIDSGLADLMTCYQRLSPSTIHEGFTLGRPVNEISESLEWLTGHSEGRDHCRNYFDSSGQAVPSGSVITEEIQEGTQAVYQQITDRWTLWWQGHWSEFMSETQVRESQEWTLPGKTDPVDETGKTIVAACFPSGGRGTFSPPTDLVLNAEWGGVQQDYLDFETGRTLAMPKHFSVGVNKGNPALGMRIMKVWQNEHGIDARIEIGKPQLYLYARLTAIDCLAWRIGNGKWESLDRDIQQGTLCVLTDDQFCPYDPEGDNFRAPASFLFKTREGTAGALQILETIQSPPGVRIRYRLVKDTEHKKRSTSDPSNNTSPPTENNETKPGKLDADAAIFGKDSMNALRGYWEAEWLGTPTSLEIQEHGRFRLSFLSPQRDRYGDSGMGTLKADGTGLAFVDQHMHPIEWSIKDPNGIIMTIHCYRNTADTGQAERTEVVAFTRVNAAPLGDVVPFSWLQPEIKALRILEEGLEAYAADHGIFPDPSQPELLSPYIDEIPLDPHSPDQHMRWTLKENGTIALPYGVGQNGIDEGGGQGDFKAWTLYGLLQPRNVEPVPTSTPTGSVHGPVISAT